MQSCSLPSPAVASVDAPESPAAAGVDEVPVERSFFEALSSVADPRSRHGRRHPLASLLGLLALGFLSGQNTVKDIVVFGRNRRPVRRWLGFTHAISPSQSTYTRLFQALPIESVRSVLAQWLEDLARLRIRRGVGTVDGKALRGCGRHILNVFVQDYWCVLDMLEVSEKKNELSAFEAEMDAMLQKYPFLQILTFDAMFSQHAVVEALTRHNRMGIFQIKDNQPETLRRLERWFHALPKDSCQVQETEKKWGLPRDPHAVDRSRAAADSPTVAPSPAGRRHPHPQRKTPRAGQRPRR